MTRVKEKKNELYQLDVLIKINKNIFISKKFDRKANSVSELPNFDNYILFSDIHFVKSGRNIQSKLNKSQNKLEQVRLLEATYHYSIS